MPTLCPCRYHDARDVENALVRVVANLQSGFLAAVSS
jgi:hypothetical protein